ncbi:Uncharacterised protein [uncultured archaeon]|nr:Uncharacterised protein [uncultured archaeon]
MIYFAPLFIDPRAVYMIGRRSSGRATGFREIASARRTADLPVFLRYR